METIKIHENDRAEFHNRVDFCVGTGRMGLALGKEYQAQLKYVQENIGFSHIRGHGLFTDDMAIYHCYTDEAGQLREEYNFTYLDLVMDSYVELHIKPFLELGFMPNKLASGEQCVFYWKGNVTPPQTYERWNKMVCATLTHLMDRYGKQEVETWPIEVWNEPNLPGFWKGADMEEYFHLFKETFDAIKALNPAFKVGGPAICGVDDERWMRCFMEFCDKENIPLDFVTRHHYTTSLPEDIGHYGYPELSDAQEGFEVLQVSRDIIDSFPKYKGLPMHITEFNTSYIPNAPVHDTNQNAAYVAHLLSRMGDVNESYSYWTFGDIFEERGVPFTPFHGGFGMVANGVIPKPTFWTFKFFKDLKGECVYRGRNAVVMKTQKGYCGVLWKDCRTRSGEGLNTLISFPGGKEAGEEVLQNYFLVTKTVDEEVCNPLRVWHEMGEPSSLTKEQRDLLYSAAQPFVATEQIAVEPGADLEVEFVLEENGVMWFELTGVNPQTDRGYDYARVMQYQ